MHRRLVPAASCAALLATAVAVAGATTHDAAADTASAASTAGGGVRVYGLPLGSGKVPLLGQAAAAPAGAFTVPAGKAPKVLAISRRNGGLLDWIAVSSRGQTGGTSRVKKLSSGAVRLVPALAPGGRRLLSAPAEQELSAPTADPATTGAVQAHAAAGSLPSDCAEKYPGGIPIAELNLTQTDGDTAVQPTIVGELNNAWNDGTSAQFSMAKGNKVSTTFGWSWDVPFDKVAGLSGGKEKERLFERRADVQYAPFTRRLSRIVRSDFRYQSFSLRYHRCLPAATYVRPISWLASKNVDSPASNGLNQCIPAELGDGFGPGDRIGTTNAAAETNTVTVGGRLAGLNAKLTVRNGFDESTGITYRFGKRPRHYVCGPDGRQSITEAARITAGGPLKTK